jgi:hypothetical protein
MIGSKPTAGAPSMEPLWRHALHQSAMVFVGNAAFPRLAYWLRWPTRLGRRGLVAYIAFNTAALFALRIWVLPRLRRQAEAVERARTELTERLGREPTNDEIVEHLASSRRGD